MPQTDIHYGDNKKFLCWNVDGILYPVLKRTMPENYEAHIRGIRSYEVRKDDIYVFSYPKAGAHWLQDIIHMLLTGSEEPASDPVLPILEFYDKTKLESLPSARILHSHLHPDKTPQAVFENKLKTILLRRNPKDTLVSFHSFLTSPHVLATPFQETLECFMKMSLSGNMLFGSPVQHGIIWESFRLKHPDHPFLEIHYEDLHQNMGEETRKLAEFLNVNITQERLDLIQSKCSFSNTKMKKTENPGTRQYSESLYRKGVAGDWKNHFSEEMSNEIEKTCAAAAEAAGVNVDYKYD